MVRLLVIRHGKTSWNAARKLQGRRDIPLSELGRTALSACRIPAEFANFHVYASPLSRARETARLLGAAEVTIEPVLIEMDWGGWEGETVPGLRARYGEAFRENEARGLDMTPPGGESPAMVAQRLRPWLQSLPGDSIAVTHKGVIRALAALAYGWDMTGKPPMRFDWSAGHLFEIGGDGMPRRLRINISLEKE